MTDRELLELAAKAAGLDYIKPAEGYSGLYGLEIGSNPMRTQSWNPLTDDGDALRLAVDLDIEVEFISDSRISACTGVPTTGGYVSEYVYEYTDKHAATRRAIVLAAAEIGREEAK